MDFLLPEKFNAAERYMRFHPIFLLVLLSNYCFSDPIGYVSPMPIRKYDGVCYRGQDSNLVEVEENSEGPAEEDGIYISEIKDFCSHHDCVFVDVRSKQEFSEYKIPDSINMSLFELNSKNYLKGKKIVIVGYGADDEDYLRYCHKLADSGFKNVKVLLGGIHIWLEAGFRAVGNIDHWDKHIRLSFSKLTSKSSSLGVFALIGHSSKYPFTFSGGNFSLDSLRSINSHSDDFAAAINNKRYSGAVFLSDTAVGDLMISHIKDRLFPIPLYVYDVGVDEYLKAKKVADGVLDAMRAGPKKLGCGL